MGVWCAEVVYQAFYSISFERQGLSLKLQLHWLASWSASWLQRSIHFSCHFPELGLQTHSALLIFLYEFWGIQTQAFILEWQILYQLNHLSKALQTYFLHTLHEYSLHVLHWTAKHWQWILLLNTNIVSILLSLLPCVWLVFIWLSLRMEYVNYFCLRQWWFQMLFAGNLSKLDWVWKECISFPPRKYPGFLISVLYFLSSTKLGSWVCLLGSQATEEDICFLYSQALLEPKRPLSATLKQSWTDHWVV